MSWEKLQPVEGSVACLTCGCGAHSSMRMKRLLAVGFGDVQVTKDGEVVYSEMQCKDGQVWEGQDAENEALKDPDHDWRVSFFAPLYDAVYQRQGEGHWVLVKKGMGFA